MNNYENLKQQAVYAGCKGTKFLANHNRVERWHHGAVAVYAGCKGTKFLANHNIGEEVM